MIPENVVDIALANLEKNTGIRGSIVPADTVAESRIELTAASRHFVFNTAVINEIRNYHLPDLIEKAAKNGPLLVIAHTIFPKIKQELRLRNIAYLETCGNIYFHKKEMTMWIDTAAPLPVANEKVNRAFTKTGLKVIFNFLLDENLINQPYRAIAERAGVSLGNISLVMEGLKKMRYLLRLNDTKYKLHNKKELGDKWINHYSDKLKPSLLTGRFRFVNKNDFNNWKELQLTDGESCWGGEPAGDLLTDYLRPAELTIYTSETRGAIVKKYHMVPDEENGNVTVYQKFWHQNENCNIAPHLLVYADLVITGDRRCMETAKKIHDGFLQDKF